ncbi:general odorant-binding protein 56h-like [Teleopsis dalmanni]|uniref:general odorant-binding protein 56h-like n=1 Tax=Teleopsis dalmanni TaxID=139649 RepID=UPI0018CD2BF1|nr:general odorant-binding protein 56h-like [Teleopsis dalmanni]
MKLSILLIVACCAIASCELPNEGIMKIALDCAKEQGVTDKEYADFHAGLIKGADVKENVKCMTKCFLTRNGFMDESGNFKADVFASKLEHMAPKLLNENVEKCISKQAENLCEKAFLISECLIQLKLNI